MLDMASLEAHAQCVELRLTSYHCRLAHRDISAVAVVVHCLTRHGDTIKTQISVPNEQGPSTELGVPIDAVAPRDIAVMWQSRASRIGSVDEPFADVVMSYDAGEADALSNTDFNTLRLLQKLCSTQHKTKC